MLSKPPSDPAGKLSIEMMEDEQSATYTVDDALISSGFGKYQILILSYAGIGLIAEAMEMMLLSFVGPSVQLEWNLTAHQESMITSVVFVGMLIGAYSWGVVSDNYGRRQERVSLYCHYDEWSWIHECLFSKLCSFNGSTVFSWYWLGRRTCSWILVLGICSCSK